MRVFHCTRAALAGLLSVAVLTASAGRVSAQSSPDSAFTIYVRGAVVGNETVTVQESPDGWTVTSTGRMGAPVDLQIRQFRARYDRNWRPLDLTIDATLRGQPSFLSTTISGTTASNELAGAPGTERVRRTDTIAADAVLMPNPFIAPYETIAARVRTAPEGTTLSLYQPGQGSFSGIVGPSAPERLQTVDRLIEARRTVLTFQAQGQPPTETEIWADETGRLLRLRIPSQGLEVARLDMSAVSTRRLTMTRPNDEELRIEANGFVLTGTLSKPANARGPLPAVVLVAGSGPTDRDENVAGIPIFGHIAHALADAGFMVLRYDKRGVGQSGGRVESATLADYAEDVRAAIRTLADRKDVDKRRIALVGHSEGGSLALITASKEKRVAGVALLATVGTTGADLNLYQVTHAVERSNRPESERQNTIQLQRQIQQAVLTGKGWEALALPDGVRRQADTPYFQSFLAFDPARLMKDVQQPILIVQGALDAQVPPDNADKLEALAKARKKNAGVEVVKVPGINHLLVPAKTGEVDEYARLGNVQVSPEVTGALSAWLKKTLTGR
ncbi:MAG: alpha/beta fold hydrolase [Vicinamibacterales bacterium]